MAILKSLIIPGNTDAIQFTNKGQGNSNAGVGLGVLNALSAGAVCNTAVGYFALCNVTSGDRNTGIGFRAGKCITTGYDNTLIGSQAYLSANCNETTVVGFAACSLAGDTVVVGAYAKANGRWGNAIGFNAIAETRSVAIGFCSRACANSVAIGYCASANACSVAIGCGAKTCGTCAVAIGCGAYAGQNSVSLGRRTGNNCINAVLIATGLRGGLPDDNSIRWGKGIHDVCNCIYDRWNYLSDGRDKTNITALSSDFGLNFIKKLRPVTFTWDKRSKYVEKCGFEYGHKDGTLAQTKPINTGIIAQELKAVLQSENLRLDALKETENGEKFTLSESAFYPVVVKGIQELSTRMEIIKTRINNLKS